MSDTSPDTNVAFVASGQIPPSPPPASTTGVVGWLRENLFSGIVNSVMTLLAIGLLVFLIPGAIQWAFIDSVWHADSLKGCRAINSDGACWAVIVERFDQFIYGFYPDSFPLYARWRPNLTFVLMLVSVAYVLFDGMPLRRVGLLLAAIFPVLGYFLIWGGTIWGPLLGLATLPVAAAVFVGASRFVNALFAFAAAAAVAVVWLMFAVAQGDEMITRAIGESRAEARVTELETFLASDIEAYVSAGAKSELAGIADQEARAKKFSNMVNRARSTAETDLANIVALPEREAEVLRRRPEVAALRAALPEEYRGIVTRAKLDNFAPAPDVAMKRRINDVISAERALVALENQNWFVYRKLGRVGLEPIESAKIGGFLLSAIIGVSGIVMSLPIGILLALGRRSGMIFLQFISITFIEFIRGVPLITLLFVANSVLAYFFPPGSNLDLILRVVIMVTLFASAYMAEVIRGGLAALPPGQYEAADSLGLDYWKSMRLIILPQALKVSIPNIVSSFIGLFKDTTLVVVIGLLDPIGLISTTRADSNWNGIIWEFYVFVGLFFWIICFGMSRYSQHLERKLATDH